VKVGARREKGEHYETWLGMVACCWLGISQSKKRGKKRGQVRRKKGPGGARWAKNQSIIVKGSVESTMGIAVPQEKERKLYCQKRRRMGACRAKQKKPGGEKRVQTLKSQEKKERSVGKVPNTNSKTWRGGKN